VTLTVNTLADDPSGPSPGSTTLTLRDAIKQADAGTGNQYTIKFAPSLRGTIDLTKALPDLDNTITIKGSGATKLTVNRTATAPFSIFTVDKSETDTISGLTITGGDATDGGGIDNLGTLTVSKVTFTDNHTTNVAGGVGGGIDNLGTLTVTNSAFTGNSASGAGGGIYNDDALTVTGTTFTDDSSFVGGSITNTGAGVATVNKDTFTHDSAVFGGGIANFDKTPLIVSHSTFTHNSATDGGGIVNFNQLNVSHSTFTHNSATNGGGIDNSGTLVNTSNVFQNNTGGNIN
jgi:hypothetical protein